MSRRTAMALLLLANALWGASYLAARVALNTLPPPLMGALRFSIASLLLWPLLLLARARWSGNPRRAAPWRVQRTDFPRLLGLGLLGVAVNHLVTTWGQSLTTATDAALLIVSEVIFTSLLAARVHRERLGRWKRVSVIVGTAGVTALVLGNRGSRGGGGLARVAGDGLIMAGLFAESVYTVLGVGLARKYGPVALLALVYAASLIVWLPTLTWYAVGGHFPPVGLAAAGGVLYLALANSLLCPLIWFKVLPHWGSNMGAISLLAQPLVGAILGVGVLHEPLTPGVAAGGCLVMLALYLGSLADRSMPADPGRGRGISLQPAPGRAPPRRARGAPWCGRAGVCRDL